MPRKKVPDRAELPEKLKHWANDNSIKASPDFLARMMEAAMHRPVPTVLGGLSFADLLCEAIPENEQRELVIEQAFRAAREKAYHEAPNKPYGSNLLKFLRQPSLYGDKTYEARAAAALSKTNSSEESTRTKILCYF